MTIQSALVRPSNVGILVQQLVHGRPVKIGRVPLGHHPRGVLALGWNGKVNGTRIPDGHYLITLRALNAHKQVIDRSAPVFLAISWGGSSEGGKPDAA